jgi:hypothetical protein
LLDSGKSVVFLLRYKASRIISVISVIPSSIMIKREREERERERERERFDPVLMKIRRE